MNWKLYILTLFLLATMPAVGQSVSETDCALAGRYYSLAQQAERDLRREDQYQFLERAVDACNRYDYWQALGDVAATFGEREKNERAAEAYIAAHDVAADVRERAQSIARYAELLFNTNYRQQALTYIYAAQNLDPDDETVAALAARIAAAAERITEDDVVRGLSEMRLKPLKLRIDPDEPTGGGSATAVATTRAVLNIPLHFEFNSTRLEPASARNVEILAQTLATQFPDRSFTFVGHADLRGTKASNLRLSTQRAEAIYALVIAIQPALRTRIETLGMGESEPLSSGATEQDHRVNRRLEVKAR